MTWHYALIGLVCFIVGYAAGAFGSAKATRILDDRDGKLLDELFKATKN